MKVICVKNRNEYNDDIRQYELTIGKEYTPYLINSTWYYIGLDNGYRSVFPKSWFMTKEEYRDKKLEDLGI